MLGEGIWIAAIVASWAAIILLAFTMSHLVAQVHDLRTAMRAGPRSRTNHPHPEKLEVINDPTTLGRLVGSTGLPDNYGITLVVREGCPTCELVLPQFAKESARGHPPSSGEAVRWTVTVVGSVEPGPNRHGLPVLGGDFARGIGVQATPFLLGVASTGEALPGSGPVGSTDVLADRLAVLMDVIAEKEDVHAG